MKTDRIVFSFMIWCVDVISPIQLMARLTITLSDERHRALKEAAVRRNKSIGQLVEECLELSGIKTSGEAAKLVAQARRRAGKREKQALEIGVSETHLDRRQ